jgi:hypothetical protein
MPTVILPTLHPDQVLAYRVPGLRKAVRCGRRWGKTELAETIACDGAAKGRYVGYFTPAYKFQTEVYSGIKDILDPVERSSSKVEGVIRTTTGGRVDFWTLENDRAGRSRKYHIVIIDEAAFGKPNTADIWEKSIEPTLLDYSGTAWVLSNTNGVDPTNFFWRVCNDETLGFKEHHAPSHNNPFVPLRRPGESVEDYIVRREGVYADLRTKTHPLVYKQEYLAEFVDWTGIQFFDLQNCLENGNPVVFPSRCDTVFAVIDTAVKGGKEHDGLATTYFALDRSNPLVPRLTVLDWEIQHLQGDLLIAWLPTVITRLESFARMCHARMGSVGTIIEDKAAGSILLMQAEAKGIPATAIDSKLTALGKDERAINASGYVYQRLVKISQQAYDKVMVYNGHSLNHFLRQVFGYRVGVKDQEDDLLDCFCYGVALALGDSQGV